MPFICLGTIPAERKEITLLDMYEEIKIISQKPKVRCLKCNMVQTVEWYTHIKRCISCQKSFRIIWSNITDNLHFRSWNIPVNVKCWCGYIRKAISNQFKVRCPRHKKRITINVTPSKTVELAGFVKANTPAIIVRDFVLKKT